MKSKFTNYIKGLLLFSILFSTNYSYGEYINPIKKIENSDSVKNTTTTQPIIKFCSHNNKDNAITSINALNSFSNDPYLRTISSSSSLANFSQRAYKISDYSISLRGIILDNSYPSNTSPSWIAILSQLNSTSNNISINQNILGGIAGTYQIDPAMFEKKLTSFSWTSSNHVYSNGFQIMHNSGILKNGWSYSLAGSHHWAQKGYVEGTALQQSSYFADVKKTFNEKHSLSLTVMGSPTERWLSEYTQLEAYELKDNNHYNPNWGMYNNNIHSSKTVKSHIPIGILMHNWNISERLSLNTAISYTTGKTSFSELEWYDFRNPNPTYYRNLPSYYKEGYPFTHLDSLWTNDSDYSQIDWDSFYQVNKKNMFTINDAEGIAGNDIQGYRSLYYISSHNTEIKNINLSSSLLYKISNSTNLEFGINIKQNKSQSYKSLESLLGGEYVLDISKLSWYFIEEPSNDINNPNNVIYEGDTFGYNYLANTNSYTSYTTTTIIKDKFNLNFAGSIGFQQMWREGFMKNASFIENSYGVSKKQNYINYRLSSSYKYKLSKKHDIALSVLILSQAPDFNDLFILPEVSNLISDTVNSNLYSANISYRIKTKSLKSIVSVYYTNIRNQTLKQEFYDDVRGLEGVSALSSLNEVRQAVELGISYKITKNFTLNTAGTYGYYYYNSRPNIATYNYFKNEIYIYDEIAYVQNFRVPNIPQTMLSAGLDLHTNNNWLCNVKLNYLDNIYSEFSFITRTESFTQGIILPNQEWENYLDQEKLNGGFTVDMSISKTWKLFNNTHSIQTSLLVSNVLNNQDIMLAGKEPVVFYQEHRKYVNSKYLFMYGRNIFLTISYRL